MPFQDPGGAPVLTWSPPAGGPFVALPANGRVLDLALDGAPLPACPDRSEQGRCFRALPGMRALEIVGPPPDPKASVVAHLAAFPYDALVLVSADPLRGTTVLWPADRGSTPPAR